jgi:hypothetical protein
VEEYRASQVPHPMGDCTKDLYYFLSHIECRSVLEV